jgi:hypothetical protein
MKQEEQRQENGGFEEVAVQEDQQLEYNCPSALYFCNANTVQILLFISSYQE